MADKDNLKEEIRTKYGERALGILETPNQGGCCSGASCDPITSNLYDGSERELAPEEAFLASLGCGNPVALAELMPGEAVLDLGSGGGIDVFLAARQVGAAGKVYGLDMTEEMLELAHKSQLKAKVENVEFLKGEIEDIPLPDDSVDVILSNCVINLSADKDQVFREAFRVLRPGGRLTVSDIVVRGEMPEEIRRSVELWIGCVAGALEEKEYLQKVEAAGFEEVTLEPTRIYRAEDGREFLSAEGIDVDQIAPLVDEKFMSACIRARKPRVQSPERI